MFPMALLAARRKGAMKHRNIIIYRRNSIRRFVVGLADVCGNVDGRRPMGGAERAWERRSAWAQRFSPFSESLSCGEVASGCVSAAGRLSRDGAESAV